MKMGYATKLAGGEEFYEHVKAHARDALAAMNDPEWDEE